MLISLPCQWSLEEGSQSGYGGSTGVLGPQTYSCFQLHHLCGVSLILKEEETSRPPAIHLYSTLGSRRKEESSLAVRCDQQSVYCRDSNHVLPPHCLLILYTLCAYLAPLCTWPPWPGGPQQRLQFSYQLLSIRQDPFTYKRQKAQLNPASVKWDFTGSCKWGVLGQSRLDMGLRWYHQVQFLSIYRSCLHLAPSLWVQISTSQDGCSGSSRPHIFTHLRATGRTILPWRFNTILLVLMGSPTTVPREMGFND